MGSAALGAAPPDRRAPSRLLRVALALALLGVAAFLVSFLLGLRGGGDGGAGNSPAPVREVSGKPRVRVEVLNAAGRGGLAREATARLRDRGFDVVYFGNAPGAVRDSSIVLERGGKPEAARAVADALGIRTTDRAPDSTLYLEASVILGKDWPPVEPEGETGVKGVLRRLRR
jgi:hypothetical protein